MCRCVWYNGYTYDVLLKALQSCHKASFSQLTYDIGTNNSAVTDWLNITLYIDQTIYNSYVKVIATHSFTEVNIETFEQATIECTIILWDKINKNVIFNAYKFHRNWLMDLFSSKKNKVAII